MLTRALIFAGICCAALAAQVPTFHVQGTIQNTAGDHMSRVKVEFQSKDPHGSPNTEQFKVLLTDDNGFYQTDLTLGDYTMTAQALDFRPYRRPLFRVTAPTRLIFDVTMREIAACDQLIFNGSGTITPDEWAAGQKDSCLREDFLPLPSHGALYQLALRYGTRDHKHGDYTYDGETIHKNLIPVFVAYNQFTLQADKVVFDPHKKTIAATGNVTYSNAPDTVQRADAANFRIENDVVVRLDAPPTFHVKGTIKDWTGVAIVPHMKIEIQSKLLDQTVTLNDAGVFEADLIVGEYSMIARNNFLKTRRIQFRAASPVTLTVNGVAYPRRLTCDIVVGGPDAASAANDLCGGEDSFEIPSDNGTFLPFYVQFEKRQRSDEQYVYSAAKNTSGDLLTPVFAEYNFFAVQANQITYDVKTATLEANGDVVVTNEAGATEHWDSASFKIENGQVKPIRTHGPETSPQKEGPQ
jgi:hypothetical protein